MVEKQVRAGHYMLRCMPVGPWTGSRDALGMVLTGCGDMALARAWTSQVGLQISTHVRYANHTALVDTCDEARHGQVRMIAGGPTTTSRHMVWGETCATVLSVGGCTAVCRIVPDSTKGSSPSARALSMCQQWRREPPAVQSLALTAAARRGTA